MIVVNKKHCVHRLDTSILPCVLASPELAAPCSPVCGLHPIASGEAGQLPVWEYVGAFVDGNAPSAAPDIQEYS